MHQSYDRQPEDRWTTSRPRARAKLAVRYGPQAKLARDRVGKQPATAAQSQTLVARRKAFAEAATVRNGSVLERGVDGSAICVVFAGEQPVRGYPPRDVSRSALLNHRGTLTP